MYNLDNWLPTTLKEVKRRGWEELDIIIFSGDAYVDHPAFGAAVIGRVLENEGFRVAIVPQPNWQDDLRDFKKLGTPRLFFGVTAGNMDSMVNHYTAARRLRANDAYTPDGKAGFRPDYATTVYSKILKDFFPETPLIIGGIEASLRRLTHYDYWKDELKPSILHDTGADLLAYGHGEKTIVEIAKLLDRGVRVETLLNIPQTAVIVEKGKKTAGKKSETYPLFSHSECLKDKKKFADNFKHIETESNKIHAKTLTQDIFDKTIIINPPRKTSTEKESDKVYDLPYTRMPHPKYRKRGAIPAYEMIKFSVNTHRGCFGGCSFCTISAHQGKFITSRSEKSILKEVKQVTQMPDFKGYLSDIGGPSANMYKMKGTDLSLCEPCKRPSCIHPKICANLNTDHSALTQIYKKVNDMEGVKKAFIGSGVRYDMLINREGEITGNHKEYAEELIKNHVSGRLKIAPEHTSDKVLKVMRKPSFSLFYKFKSLFDKINSETGMKQQLIPYFISSHPGSTDTAMAELAAETKALEFKLEQVQDFTPTPMTVATVIFYSGFHPYTLLPMYTPRSKEEKLNQRMFFFWHKREYHGRIKSQLKKMQRNDLVEKLFARTEQQKQQQLKRADKKPFKKGYAGKYRKF